VFLMDNALRPRKIWKLASLTLAAAIVTMAGSTPGRDHGPAGPESALAPVRLHIELRSSVPAQGDTIRSRLDRMTLVFSGPVEPKLSSVRWIGLAGDTLSLRVTGTPDQSHVLETEAPPGENGAQKLVWRTVSADGHQAAGEVSFVMAAPEFAAPAAAEVVAVPDQPVREDEIRSVEFSTSRITARGIGMFCLLGFAGLLWFGPGTRILDELRPHRLASILGLGAILLLSVDLLLWMSNLRLPDAGLGETFSAVLGTRSGAVEIWRVGLVGAAFLMFTGTGLVRLGSVTAMAAVVIGALGGHQATIRPLIALPANGLHLGAAAVWAGGLLLLASWPASALVEDMETGWTFERIARRVSAAALLASCVILVTAIVQDLLYLPSLGALFTSGYGKLLLSKSVGFAALVFFGAYNRFRLIPALHGGIGARPLQKSVRLEVIVIAVTVMVAVVLAQVPPPLG
ncbi:MAG: copper resistance protein CopC/CopD, partial [Gemmatimonadota bacterium]|nr:copper resistance protein CopC/CopD [Gemmatimonadota bacterium]